MKLLLALTWEITYVQASVFLSVTDIVYISGAYIT
jgi:hypothetical protein